MFDVFRRQLTVRSCPGYFDINGIWIKQPYVMSIIRASVQDLDDDTLEALPEGYRTKQMFSLITNSILKLSIVNKNTADQVNINGYWYQVVRLKSWSNTWIENNYYEAIVLKMDDDDVN